MDEASGGDNKPKWWSRSRRPETGSDSDEAQGSQREHGSPAPTASESAGEQNDPSGGGEAPAEPEQRSRETPRHPEDPYGTPPYGGPGPWALAPPVQHPRAMSTPAHGTGVPPAPVAGTPAYGTGVPPAAGAGSSPQWQHRYDPWAAPQGPGGPPPETTAGYREAGPPGPRRRTLVAGALVVALLAGGVGGAVGMYIERHGGLDRVSLSQAPAGDTDRPADSVAGIAAATLPGVVTLHAQGASGRSTGTGFVLDDKGHILTNHHVVRSAEQGGRIVVTFNGGETVRARLVGGDGGYDLAVVKVERVSGLKPLPLGNSESVQVGDPVVAIGSPFDLAGTVTTGIISAKERPITAGGRGDGSDVSYVNALQTDAPINPGNSGGPLVDTKGRVIGVNSAIRSGEGERDGGPGDQGSGSVGLGFAIPINQGKRVAEELISTGKATHPVIGVSVDMSKQGEDGARVGSDDSDQPGVVADGPADEAGIKEGDLITAVNGSRVRNGEELIVKIRSQEPGDVLELTVERDDEELKVDVTLGTGSSR